jgi:hypothetical protein
MTGGGSPDPSCRSKLQDPRYRIIINSIFQHIPIRITQKSGRQYLTRYTGSSYTSSRLGLGHSLTMARRPCQSKFAVASFSHDGRLENGRLES